VRTVRLSFLHHIHTKCIFRSNVCVQTIGKARVTSVLDEAGPKIEGLK
jgi:hypothetical protein